MSNATKPAGRQQSVHFSADFLAWYELAKAYPAVMHADGEWEREHLHRGVRVPDEVFDARPCAQHLQAMRVLEERIYAQPVHGFEDVAVIAEIGMVGLFWCEKGEKPKRQNDADFDPFELGCDVELDNTCQAERAAPHLVQAAARMFLGGAGTASVRNSLQDHPSADKIRREAKLLR